MYPRGSDRGWHRGNNQRDVPAVRGHNPRPYRGVYNAHRDHGNYGSGGYHDFHDNPHHDYLDYSHHDYQGVPCYDFHDDFYHDRDYDDRQFQDHEEPRHHGGESAYNEYRNFGYHRGGRAKLNYRGAYKQRGRGDPVHHHNKHTDQLHKQSTYNKADKKDNGGAGRSKPSTIKTSLTVVHNHAHNVVAVTSGHSSEEEDTVKASGAPVMTMKKHKSVKPMPDIKTEALESDSGAPKQELLSTEEVFHINMRPTAGPKEDVLPSAQTLKIKEEGTLERCPSKRPHSEEREFSLSNEKREGETCTGKKVRNDSGSCNNDSSVNIPLLDGWVDVPPQSPLSPCAKEGAIKSDADVSDAARVLRTAFILARKEEIELAYAQDCRTFAFVANMLLKNDPSLETAVTSALRSTLQEIAGNCVHELSSFIDRYDMECNVVIDSTIRDSSDN